MKIKFTMSKANHDAKAAKKASAPCSQYVTDIAAAKDSAMNAYFNTPELQAIRKLIEDSEK